jgi:hypothetical protein
MKNIPIRVAKEIADKYDWPEVVIFAYEPDTNHQHITTYGKTIKQCEDAAMAGNYFKEKLGWPKELCNALPRRIKSKVSYKTQEKDG